PRLKPNPIHRKAKFLEETNKSFRLARDLRLLHDLAPPIHNANAREFQRHVDSGIVFHGCPPSLDAWGRLTSAPASSSIGGQSPSPLARSEAHYCSSAFSFTFGPRSA